ncbi:MAG: hypothetical protein MMC33_010285 [Icmadophila ericetorum]|nr:hypothetical protein [Icmadophila ericetorum]
MTHPRASFLGLPLEIRLEIYAFVFYRPCPTAVRYNWILTFTDIAHTLRGININLLLVSKQVHIESLPVAYACNTFPWPYRSISENPPLLRARLNLMKSILIDADATSIHFHTAYLGGKEKYVANAFPPHLRRIIVNSRCTSVETFMEGAKKWGEILSGLEVYGKVPVYWLRPEDMALQQLMEVWYPGRLLAEPWGGNSTTLTAWTLDCK